MITEDEVKHLRRYASYLYEIIIYDNLEETENKDNFDYYLDRMNKKWNELTKEEKKSEC